jgi:hypothetical protein
VMAWLIRVIWALRASMASSDKPPTFADQAFVVSEVESTWAGGCCLVPNFHLSHPLLLGDSSGDGIWTVL